MMAGLFLLAGCSSPGAESVSGDSGLTEDGGAGGAVADRAAPEQARSGPSGANRTTVRTRAVIRRGSITLVTQEMNRARTAVDDLLGRHGGYLASEDTTNDRAGRPEHSVLVLRVPEPAFGEAMDELGDIGRTVRADRSSEDVTTEVIDVDSRVATAEASLARLQRFLRQAERVEDMIRLESEIATRQAELESMKAQQTYLRDQTSLSTITVRLRTPDAPPVAPADDAGFLTGLANGWAALRTVLVGLATVTGAMLPFALAIGVLAVPVLLLVRTARRRRQTATPPPAPEAG
jgi:hypothetical protein